jgi:cytochrome c5
VATQKVDQQMIELKGTYRIDGEMFSPRVGGKVYVAECPTCHALVLWDSVDQHDEWHIRQAKELEQAY